MSDVSGAKDNGTAGFRQAGSNMRTDGRPRFTAQDGGRWIDDDDFQFDAILRISGDFSDEDRARFAQWVCDALNAADAMSHSTSPPPESVISRDEWQRRYAARIMECAGWPEHAAIEAARVGAEEYEREAGNAVVWLGVSAGGPWDTPEDLADEEMSYWEDDGD